MAIVIVNGFIETGKPDETRKGYPSGTGEKIRIFLTSLFMMQASIMAPVLWSFIKASSKKNNPQEKEVNHVGKPY